MRWLPLWLMLCVAGCDEPARPPAEPEAPAPEPEPEPPAEPPHIGAIDAPEGGQAKVAVPTLNQGFEFPVQTLEAGFGRDETMVLVELKAEGEGDLSVQLTFHEGSPELGAHPIDDTPGEGATTASLGGTQLQLLGGRVILDALEDQRLAGSFDLEVKEPRSPEPTRLRGRFDAARHRYYDGVIGHQRAIRDQLRKRR